MCVTSGRVTAHYIFFDRSSPDQLGTDRMLAEAHTGRSTATRRA